MLVLNSSNLKHHPHKSLHTYSLSCFSYLKCNKNNCFCLVSFVFLQSNFDISILSLSLSLSLSGVKMFAETGLLFPYLQNYSHEFQQLEEYCMTHKSNASMVPSIFLSCNFQLL